MKTTMEKLLEANYEVRKRPFPYGEWERQRANEDRGVVVEPGQFIAADGSRLVTSASNILPESSSASRFSFEINLDI